MTRIEISLDPTDLEFTNGDRYDPDKLLDAIKEFALSCYPDATFVTLQVGYRQGDCWYRVNGDREEGNSLMEQFWHARAADEDLFTDTEEDSK